MQKLVPVVNGSIYRVKHRTHSGALRDYGCVYKDGKVWVAEPRLGENNSCRFDDIAEAASYAISVTASVGAKINHFKKRK